MNPSPQRGLPDDGVREAFVELIRATKRYIECQNPAAGLSPYVEFNGRYGTKSPWREFQEAIAPAEAALALLDQPPARAEGEWRPIESAPKDGTPILAWCVHPHARWATDDKEWCAPVVTQWINHNGGGWTWNGMAGTFTHWRPLPAAPPLPGQEGAPPQSSDKPG